MQLAPPSDVIAPSSEENAVIGFIHTFRDHSMKKPIVCGSAAILMTGLTVSVFTTAEPRVDRETTAYVSAAATLTDGTTVRIRSAAIESGWHTGRIARDARSCSMVQLDRPTQHGYTQLALMAVDALQLGRTGDWKAFDARRAIASEPSHCLVEGAG